MLGQLLDRRYRVVGVLAAGGFGQTYVAEDTRRPGCPKCVVKHLKPVGSDSSDPTIETAKRLFNSEAETLERLGHHDRIPQLLAYFDENQEFYLVQEFVEGHTLSTELTPGHPWSEGAVIDLLQEVLTALEFVHHQGVIHRDIKPDNIIRRQCDRKLVLVDFGAVKQLRAHLAMAQLQPSATIAIGTPGYMPTEQGHGKPRPNSDIYALGMIGIQALTGWQPLQFEEDLVTGEILWQHLVPVSPGLADVLTKMVRYHFKDRYQTAPEALQALQSLPSMSSQFGVECSPNGVYAPLRRSPLSQQRTTPVAPAFAAVSTSPARQGQIATGSRDLLPLLVGMGVSVVVVAVGVIWSRAALTDYREAGANVTSSPQCLATISPHSNIRSEPTSTNPDNIIQDSSNLPNQLRLPVTGVRTQGGWLEVKPPERLAWVSLAVVANRGEMESCLIASGIPIRTVTDSDFASRPTVKLPTDENNSVDRTADGSSGQVLNTTHPDESHTSDDGLGKLAQATEKYQSGDIKGAIALLRSIHSSSSVFSKAAGAIVQWQGDWAKAEAELNAIQQAVNENRWDKVLAHGAANPNIKYWRDRIIQLVKEADQKKAIQLRLPKLTVSPSSTNAPTAVSPSHTDATNSKRMSEKLVR